MNKVKAGILLFYLELYDEVLPNLRDVFYPLIEKIKKSLEEKFVEVIASDICRKQKEFEIAVREFEIKKVDVIITLHLAYSPSLESIEALKSTKIPLIVFDTSIKNEFSKELFADDIMANHGIHGVQDMCNILIRNKKPFLINAGHYEEKKVIDQLYNNILSAKLFKSFFNSKIGSLGGPFLGMGDFFVEPEKLQSDFDFKIIEKDFKELSSFMPEHDSEELKSENYEDLKNFDINFSDNEVHLNTNKVGLAVRKWIEKNNLDAFTMNFANLPLESGVPTIPFLEASKAMARAIGYAGEGDILTSALTGALLKISNSCTFTEMFCADWQNNIIFLSHMGELNLNLISGRPLLIKKELAFIKVGTPVFAVGQLRKGQAVLVNLAPGPSGYTLILSEIEMIEIKNDIKESVSGWFKPKLSVPDFLTSYSEYGGTHHCALCYDADIDILKNFGKLAGFKVIVI